MDVSHVLAVVLLVTLGLPVLGFAVYVLRAVVRGILQ